jgi:hypothetical protein
MVRLHLSGLAASLPIIIVALVSMGICLSGLSVSTVATNLYPVLLQRYNRARCQLLMARRRRRWNLAAAQSQLRAPAEHLDEIAEHTLTQFARVRGVPVPVVQQILEMIR